MLDLDLRVIESAKRLAELRPEKYRFEGDEGYEAFPRLKNKYITLLIPMQSIDYDYLNMILADEGYWFEIKTTNNDRHTFFYVIRTFWENESIIIAGETPFNHVDQIPNLKQMLLKEIFVKFVELLEKK